MVYSLTSQTDLPGHRHMTIINIKVTMALLLLIQHTVQMEGFCYRYGTAQYSRSCCFSAAHHTKAAGNLKKKEAESGIEQRGAGRKRLMCCCQIVTWRL